MSGGVRGHVHPAFAPAVAYFSKLFGARSRGGGALSVRLRGRSVVDVWAGFADRRASRPWSNDTVTICFSTTKGVAAAVIHRLADRGLIDYDAAVASYWPEFAAAGKEAITVRELLSHQAGLHSVADLVERPLDLLDHLRLERRLADRAPDRLPGHPAYHAFTYGWLLAGLARRVTGLGMRELVRVELAAPLDTDSLCIGEPPDGLARFAPPISWAPPIKPTSPLVSGLGKSAMTLLGGRELTRRFAEALYVPGFDELFAGPRPLVLSTEMPSVNGLFSAHALAKLYATYACGGEVEGTRLLSRTTVRLLGEVQTCARDAVLGLRMMWRLGYHRPMVKGARGSGAFGHYGYGGSGGWADPETGLSFGFVTNELRLMQAPAGGDRRIFRLGGLILSSGRELVSNSVD